MSKPILFARLAKFDEETGYFEAIAADETLDKTREIFDYAKSKPHFEAWSALIKGATDGKSVGNVRAMHGKVSAGVLKSLDFDDEHRAIKVSGLVVDANEKVKMAAGCYTGVSIGGDYGERWDDPVLKGVTRYEAKPVEISIVDIPCNPAATFTVVKSDKTEEMRKFAPREDDTVLTAEEAEAVKKFAEDPTAVPSPVLQTALAKVARRKDTSAKKGESEYGNVTFADETNKKYPIDTPAHIRAAWNYINKAKNAGKYSDKDASAIKAKIVKAWKEHIDPKGPPSAEKALEGAEMAKAASIDCAASVLVEKAAADPKVAGQLSKLAQFVGAPLEKGFWAVSQLADLIMRMEWCMRDAECEEAMEQDGSTIPAQLAEAGANLCHILLAMAEEECDETFKHGDYEDDDETTKAVAAGKLTKIAARHSAELPAMTKRATEAEAKVVDLEKAATASGERIKALEKDVGDGQELMLKAAETIDDQKRVLTKIMAEPSAKRPAMFALNKVDDALPVPGENPTEEKLYKADGTVDEVRMALRKSLRTPIVQG